MNRAVFFDRDGTLGPDVHYCSRPEDLRLFENTGKVIRELNRQNIKVLIITNQSGIARGYFSEEMLEKIHQEMKERLKKDDADIDGIYYCPHHPDDNCECRKPKTLLIERAQQDFDIDLARSFVVGDSDVDIELGKAAGCTTILLGEQVQHDDKNTPDFQVSEIIEVLDIIENSGKDN